MHADIGKEALGVHSCYVLGQTLDSEKNRIAIVLSTQNLLLNAYRLTRNGTVLHLKTASSMKAFEIFKPLSICLPNRNATTSLSRH